MLTTIASPMSDFRNCCFPLLSTVIAMMMATVPPVIIPKECATRLSAQDKGRLGRMIRSGRSSAQAITRARIPLKTREFASAILTP